MTMRRVVAVLAAAMLAMVSTSKGDVIFSNLGPGDSYNTFTGAIITGDSFGDLRASGASSFTTGASAWNFESAQIALRNGSGSNSFYVSIMNDASGAPGDVIQSILLTGVPTGPTLVTVIPDAPVTLQADTTYWIALGGNGDAAAEWYIGRTSGSLSATKLGDGPWAVDNLTAPALRVGGMPVPEPTALLLLGIPAFFSLHRRS